MNAMSIFITVIHICGLNGWGGNYYLYKWDSIVSLEEENSFSYHILHTHTIDTSENLSFKCRNFALEFLEDLMIVRLCFSGRVERAALCCLENDRGTLRVSRSLPAKKLMFAIWPSSNSGICIT